MNITTLAVIASMIAGSPLIAQTSGGPDSSLPVLDGTPVPLQRAVIIAFDGKTIEFQTTGKESFRAQLSAHPTLVSGGRIGEPSSAELKRGVKVLLHFMQTGAQPTIDRIILDQ